MFGTDDGGRRRDFRRRRRRIVLLGATVLGGTWPGLAQAQSVPVLPAGGTVVAGEASVGTTGSVMDIAQSSQRAVIDWAGFSIGEGGAVHIANGSGATLNRVTGADVSRIDGLLTGTGSVYLLNANGVVIGKSGVVQTGGTFVAATLDIANADFMAGGDLTLSGTSRATVVNLGKVGSLGGNVSLVGLTVTNSGEITAPDGTAGLLAGSSVLLRDSANDAGGLFSVLVGGAESSATNEGLIQAASAELRAQQGNVYALAGNSSGTINATGVRTGQAHTNGYSVGGTLYSGDSVTGVAGLGSGTNAASYADQLGGATGVGLANYTISYVNGSLTIDPATLTVTYTALPVNRIQGAENPAFSGSISAAGLMGGDTLAQLSRGTVIFTSTATASSAPGSYPVVGGGLTLVSANYTPLFVQAEDNAVALTVVAGASTTSVTINASAPFTSLLTTIRQQSDALNGGSSGYALSPYITNEFGIETASGGSRSIRSRKARVNAQILYESVIGVRDDGACDRGWFPPEGEFGSRLRRDQRHARCF